MGRRARGTTSRASRFRAAVHRHPGRLLAACLGVLAAALLAAPLAPHPAGGATADAVRLPPPGVDVSWPSCTHPAAHPLPDSPAFAIVGVNDGVPGTANPCLASQIDWASTASGGTRRPALEYYVMAADPFSPYESKWAKPDWPRGPVVDGRRIPVPPAYGRACDGRSDRASCAYLFGWRTAAKDAQLAGVRNAGTTRWWIDVEAVRDWSLDTTFNQAVVEGMAAFLTAPVASGGLASSAGLYSTTAEWPAIVGVLRDGSPLAALPNWVSIGTGTEAQAAAAFAHPEPFVAGSHVPLVQFWRGGVDFDYAPSG